MTQDAPAPETTPDRRPRRIWLTVGEVVAVAGLVLGGLNYWDNHRERTEAERHRAQTEAQARPSILVLRGDADAEGARVMLVPMGSDQAIQTQRYLFPRPVLDHPMEIDAGRPQIDLAWFEGGLRRELKSARDSRRGGGGGEAELPVGIVTSYVEGGETRTDRSLYRVGYAASSRFLGGTKLRLLGVSLVQRNVKGDLQAQIDRMWSARAPGAPAGGR